jgi:hypothetical protein
MRYTEFCLNRHHNSIKLMCPQPQDAPLPMARRRAIPSYFPAMKKKSCRAGSEP